MPASRSLLALAVTACVLAAGCAGLGGPPGTTPENPQTTMEPSETTAPTTGPPPSGLAVWNTHNESVRVAVTLVYPTNGTTFYSRETTMDAGSQLYLTGEVATRDQYRVTVEAPNATHTHEVYGGESYYVTIENESSVGGHHTTT